MRGQLHNKFVHTVLTMNQKGDGEIHILRQQLLPMSNAPKIRKENRRKLQKDNAWVTEDHPF